MTLDEKAHQPLAELIAAGDSVDSLYAALRAAFEGERKAVSSADDLKALRDRWMGRKNGLIAAANDAWLKAAPRELKPQVGKRQNEARQAIEAALEQARSDVAALGRKREALDVTLPGPERRLGAKHPVRRTLEEILSIFRELGYAVAEGPEIESFFYNFEALNFPADHPAVDEMDTLFVEDKMLLRTHTSPNQIRIMEKTPPPMRYVVHGKVYRNDAPDATHSPMFQQLEVFCVDQNITLADLKGTLEHFVRRFFGQGIKTRLRPSFFPFTEPSAELDITCVFCAGRGCRICKQTGFIELLGCGMIDPNVFRAAGLDPEKYQGFAAGFGLDRIAMNKYDINDISLLYNGDTRFLRQFR
jgi:phenylalanyl-tRNA synthetase alpha chain